MTYVDSSANMKLEPGNKYASAITRIAAKHWHFSQLKWGQNEMRHEQQPNEKNTKFDKQFEVLCQHEDRFSPKQFT